METGALIRDEGGLIAEVRSLRREVEALKRAGYVQEPGTPSPGGLLTAAQLAKINAGSDADEIVSNLSANSLLGRVGSAAAGSVPVSAQSVLGRAAADVDDLTASASQILARLSTGDLGFQDRLTWAADQNVMVNEAWEAQEITGNTTLDETKVLAILNHSSDVLVSLPSPTYSGKVFIVADPLGALNGSAGIEFATPGSDELNGSLAISSKYTGDYSIFLFISAKVSGVTYWTGHVFAGSSEIT